MIQLRKNRMNMKEQSVKQRQTAMKKAVSTSTQLALPADTITGEEAIGPPDGEEDSEDVVELISLPQFFVQGVVVEVTQSNSAPLLSQPLQLQQNQS